MDAKDKKLLVKRLYDFAFSDNLQWNEWFFENVYDDSEAFLLEQDGLAISSLFLQSYAFKLHNLELPMAYIAGATTDIKFRGHGYMSCLLRDALKSSFKRGDALAGIIPANRRLFFFYDKFGFATTVYADIERFTALHSFPVSEDLTVVDKVNYDAFLSLELTRPASVIHSLNQFENILQDNEFEKGVAVQVNDSDGNALCIAFADANGKEIHVKELLGTHSAAIDMALGKIKHILGEKPMVVWRVPSDEKRAMLRERAMLRIVNVEKILTSLATQFPNLSQTIQVSDNIIDENNGTFIIHEGKVTVRQSQNRTRNMDYPSVHNQSKSDSTVLNVTVDTLCRIIFSAESIGRIFRLPTCRPSMNLMLD